MGGDIFGHWHVWPMMGKGLLGKNANGNSDCGGLGAHIQEHPACCLYG